MLLLQAVAFADSVLNCGYPDTYIPPTTSTKPRFTVKSPRSASCNLVRRGAWTLSERRPWLVCSGKEFPLSNLETTATISNVKAEIASQVLAIRCHCECGFAQIRVLSGSGVRCGQDEHCF